MLTTNFLLQQIDRLIDGLKPRSVTQYYSIKAETLQLFNDYAKDSYFLKQAENISDRDPVSNRAFLLQETLVGFRNYINSGLANPVSLQRQAQVIVVNDFLEQADLLLNDTKVHPVAPIVIIGASLEEFLRNWCIDAQLLADEVKGSIDKYAQLLRGKELINKQDVKDITSWGGLRNEAAHGHWQGAESRETARLMLMGVNLFMRKYAPESR